MHHASRIDARLPIFARSLRRRIGETKPLRVFAALAAAKTGLDGRGEMGSTVGPQLWNFQVERLDVGVMASPETGWEA